MRASTMDCLRHLVQIPGEKGRDLKGHLLRFLDLNWDSTVRRWIKGDNGLYGENELRLRTFLSIISYDVEEWRGVPATLRNAIELIAFRIATFDEMATSVEVSHNHLVRILTGKQTLSEERAGKLANFYQVREAELDREKKELLAIVAPNRVQEICGSTQSGDGALGQSSAPVPATNQWGGAISTPAQAQPAISITVTDKETLIQAAAAVVKSLMPLAEHLASDSSTATDRDKLREILGNGTINKLKTLVVRLCGERARAESIAQSQSSGLR